MSFDLANPAAPLERFGDCLGIERNAWSGEALDEVAAPADTMITAGRLSTCQEEVVEVVAAYGDALKSESGWSKIKGLSEDLELRPGLSRSRITSFLDRLKEDIGDPNDLPELKRKLVFRLNKRKLLEDHLRDVPKAIRPALFLYSDGLQALLSGRLSSLETWWEEGSPGKVVLFVPEWNHSLNGPCIAIVGGDPQAGMDRLLASSPQPAHSLPGSSR